MFWLLGWAIVGLVAGWLARKVVPGVRSGGLVVDCFTGLVGSLIGGVLAWLFPFLTLGFGFLGTIWISFVGAVVLLFILKMTSRSKVRY